MSTGCGSGCQDLPFHHHLPSALICRMARAYTVVSEPGAGLTGFRCSLTLNGRRWLTRQGRLTRNPRLAVGETRELGSDRSVSEGTLHTQTPAAPAG